MIFLVFSVFLRVAHQVEPFKISELALGSLKFKNQTETTLLTFRRVPTASLTIAEVTKFACCFDSNMENREEWKQQPYGQFLDRDSTVSFRALRGAITETC